MKVSELMSTEVHTCATDDALHEAARLMWTYDVGVIPVVDGQGQVVGMLTDRDIAMAAFLRGQPLATIPVSSTMSRMVHSCRADDDVAVAESLMAEKQIRRLPVIDASGGLAGLLSVNDLSRAASRSAPELSPGGVVKTLGAIGQPRQGEGAPGAETAGQDGAAHSKRTSRLRGGVGVFDAGDDAASSAGDASSADDALSTAASSISAAVSGLANAASDAASSAMDSAGSASGGMASGALSSGSAPTPGSSMADEPELSNAMDDLRKRRDELRLQMHLARAEARDEWEKAEEGWRSLQTRLMGSEGAAAVASDVQDLMRKLLQDIGEGYRRIRHSLQSS